MEHYCVNLGSADAANPGVPARPAVWGGSHTASREEWDGDTVVRKKVVTKLCDKKTAKAV